MTWPSIPPQTGVDPHAGHIRSLSVELISSEPTTLASALLQIGCLPPRQDCRRLAFIRSERKCLPFGSGLLKGSIPEMPEEVTVQQVTVHFLSLPSGALCWVRRKGDLQ